jgi:transcriptional regulator of arginine metabolism
MQKTKRLSVIERIISEENISSHEVLLRRLKSKGIKCTQATLSRDLRQLGTGRIPNDKGGYKYVLPESNNKIRSEISRFQVLPVITDIVDARNLLLIKTLPGNASNTAIFIDNASRYEVAGTIAGDDTILVIPRYGISNNQVHTCLELLFPGLHEQIKRK